MSHRLDYYFRQRVTEAELDLGFSQLEQADHDLAADLGFVGVLANAAVSQHAPVPDLTVDISGPGAVLDQLGQRIFFSALQSVNVAQDDNGVTTGVAGAGNEKIVSVFVKFDRALSDPRVDGNSLTVFFRRDESFKFIVVQGAEAAAGGAIPPPLRSDAILLADITRAFGQTQVLNSNISVARRQDAFVATGSPRSIRRGKTLEVIADLLSFYNAHANGTADRHLAAAVDYAGGGAWADGSMNPATTVEAQLDKLVADLAATSGAPKLGAAATAGSPNSLVAGTVKSQLDALLSAINAHINNGSGAHAASAVSYAGGGSWADATTNPATTVEAQLDKVVSDLAGSAGADKTGASIGAVWGDGTGISATRVKTAIEEILQDLAASQGGFRVGAGATSGSPNSLSAGTVKSQLDALLGFINGHINSAGTAHPASALSYAGGGNWADGTTNPAATVEAQLDKLVSDLAGPGGADKIGATISGNWADGTGVAATRLDQAIEELVSDLAASAGAGRIGAAIATTWADATGIAATNVKAAIEEVVTDLASTSAGARLGYAAPAGEVLAANTVKGGIDRAISRGLRRNFLHNGNFCVWRREGNYVSSNITYAPTKKYPVDRWYLVSNNGSSGNGQLDLYPYVDGSSLEKYGLVLDKYGTGANEVSLTQEIERVDVPHLAGKTVGLSFRVQRPSFLPANGTFKVQLIAGTGASNQVLTTPYTGQTTVIDSGAVSPPLDSFQTYGFTGTVPANATTLAVKISYLPTGNNSGERIHFQWLSLVIGTPSTEFDYASGSRSGEYQLCRFYYENSYENGGLAHPGYNNGRVGFGITLPSNGNAANSNFLVGVVRMEDKRNRPTIRLYSVDFSGNILGRLNTAPMGGGSNASFACNSTGIGTNEFELYVPVGASPALDLNGNKTIYGEWDADADY